MTSKGFGWIGGPRQLVERNLEILSEASRRLPDELKEQEAHIPWRAVAG